MPLSDNTADNLSGSGHAKHRRVVEAFLEVIRIVFERNIQLFCSKHGLMRLPEDKVDDIDDTNIYRSSRLSRRIIDKFETVSEFCLSFSS